MSTITGIYLNLDTDRIVRVQAMPTAPEGPRWMKVADDPNAGVVQVREIARAKGLVANADAIQWDIDLEAIRKSVGAEVVEWPEEAGELSMVA